MLSYIHDQERADIEIELNNTENFEFAQNLLEKAKFSVLYVYHV